MRQSQRYLDPMIVNLLRFFVIAGSIFLFTGGPDYYSPRSYITLWDLGHILFFTIFSYLVLLNLSNNTKKSFLWQGVYTVSIVSLLSVLIELTQAGSSRSPSFWDAVRNIIGCLIALSFFASANKTIPKRRFRALQTTTVISVAIALVPFLRSASDELIALNQFPVLSDFETPSEADRWAGNSRFSIDHSVYFHGKSSLKVMLNTSLYSGASLKYFPGDWHKYRLLHLSIFNPDKEAINITVRIHDKRHSLTGQAYTDRFNRSYHLLEGWNHIRIPLDEVANAPENRRLELDNVQLLGLFVTRLGNSRSIYIDYVHLAVLKTQASIKLHPHKISKPRYDVSSVIGNPI
jgi:hypothetical protein